MELLEKSSYLQKIVAPAALETGSTEMVSMPVFDTKPK
jgi:hypothetical protein